MLSKKSKPSSQQTTGEELPLFEIFKVKMLVHKSRDFQTVLSTHTNFILAANGENLKEHSSESEIHVALFIRSWASTDI